MSMNTEKFTFQDMQELVIAVAELFGLPDEDIYQAIINREEDMKHICDFYRLKIAS